MIDGKNAPKSIIQFTMSKNETIVVDYQGDDKTDLFQVGRAESEKIDFRVDSKPAPDGTSTVSRFAFRLLVNRKKPYEARIFAAGFDETNCIVLGENAKKWKHGDGKYDGLVTNGILIRKPENATMQSSPESSWREVSVSGKIFPVRGQRWIPSKDQELRKENNILEDGTLIDLCGATLLWRSRLGLSKSADIEMLHKNIATLNDRHIICPVQLRTLVIKPSKNRPSISSLHNLSAENDPFCYLNCGHVASPSLLQWGKMVDDNNHTCPLCRQVGPLIKLQLGLEPSFYVDKELPSWCFKPCGHAASEQTVR